MTSGFARLSVDTGELTCSNPRCVRHTDPIPYPSGGYEERARCPFCRVGRLRFKKIINTPPEEGQE